MKSFRITSNFIAVLLLIGLIAMPIYFAKNFAKVAGVKSESKYLLVSQIEKFPNLSFSQSGDQYKITYTKFGPSQAFLGIFILNNPTGVTQTYTITTTSGNGELFFGQDLRNQQTTISVPNQTSIPISLISDTGSSDSQTIEFKIKPALEYQPML